MTNPVVQYFIRDFGVAPSEMTSEDYEKIFRRWLAYQIDNLDMIRVQSIIIEELFRRLNGGSDETGLSTVH